MGHPVAPSRRRRAWLNCFGCLTTKDMNNLAAQNGEPVTEPAPSGGIAAADVAKKGAASSSGSVAPVVTVAEVSSSSSGILAVYEPKLTNDVYSTDAAASTSYPQTTAGYHTDWKNLGVCMASARDMEACVDGVLEGSIKSAQTLFARYDMNLDMRLNQQDYYDLMLELNLALPYQDYQRFVDSTFCYADCDSDGLLTIDDFIPLYKSIAAVRRGFKRQDHHSNGQIDRYDFYQLLLELGLEGGKDGVQAIADTAFSLADNTNRGIVNFGQTLAWYGSYLLANSQQASRRSSQQ